MTKRQRIVARALYQRRGQYMTARDILAVARRRRWRLPDGFGQGGIITAARALAHRGVVTIDPEYDTDDGPRLAFAWTAKAGPTDPKVDALFEQHRAAA